MNILFITFNGISGAPFGGAKASLRNYHSVQKYGNVIPYEIKKRSNIKSFISILQGHVPPLLNSDIQAIRKIINQYHVDVVFYDTSILGSVLERISIPSIAFFHNCEHDYNTVRFGKEKSIKKTIYQEVIDKSEKSTINHANRICTFNERDSSRLESLYGRKADIIIPLSIEDTYQETSTEIIKGTQAEKDHEKTVLLFGPEGSANNEAFIWFAEQVSPYLQCNTLIAGKGMDHLKYLESNKVRVKGYVESLQALYDSVDCVAIPLLSGGGMKIKTAEALMYGKYIFGSTEAFIGYEDHLSPEFSKLCISAEDFISNINEFIHKAHDKFYPKARESYLRYYSPQATQTKFDELFSQFIKQ